MTAEHWSWHREELAANEPVSPPLGLLAGLPAIVRIRPNSRWRGRLAILSRPQSYFWLVTAGNRKANGHPGGK